MNCCARFMVCSRPTPERAALELQYVVFPVQREPFCHKLCLTGVVVLLQST